MDNWLKGLIAVACVVVIAGGGYFVWNDHRDRVEREEIAQRRATQAMCNVMLDDFKTGKTTHDWRVLHVSKCIVDGYLSEDDFSDPALKPYLDQARKVIDADRKARTSG